jgi:Flp pilus assembly protein TadG
LVEFALCLPILLLLLAGGADLARAYFIGIEVADGARQAALYAADNPGYTSSQLQMVAENNAGSGVLTCPSSHLTVTAPAPTADPNSPSGASAFTDQTVTVSCALPLLLPLIHSPATITSTVTAVIYPT